MDCFCPADQAVSGAAQQPPVTPPVTQSTSQPPKPQQQRPKPTCRGGIKTRNPYLLFLRDYRQQHCGMRPTEVVRQGAKEWRGLDAAQKLKYYMESRRVPRKPKKEKPGQRRSRARSQSRARSRSRSQSRSRRSKSEVRFPPREGPTIVDLNETQNQTQVQPLSSPLATSTPIASKHRPRDSQCFGS